MDDKIIRPNVIITAVVIVGMVAFVGFGIWLLYSAGDKLDQKGWIVAITIITCVALLLAYLFLKMFHAYIINNKGITSSGWLGATSVAWGEVSKAVFYYGHTRTPVSAGRSYGALHLEVNGKVAMEIIIWPVLNADELVKEIHKYLPLEKISDGGDAMLGGASRLWHRTRKK